MQHFSSTITHIRIIATLVIVAYHCSCPYLFWFWEGGSTSDNYIVRKITDFIFFKLLSNTMLPTFFMISGILFYSRKEHYSNLKNTLWNKFDRLIIPFTIMTTICLSLDLPMIGIASANGHLWFIRELFIFFAIALGLYQIKEHWLMTLGIICYSLYVLQSRLNFSTNDIVEHFFMYFLFFIGGHYVALYYKQIRKNKVRYTILFLWFITFLMEIQSFYTILFNLILIGFIPNTSIKNKLLLSINKKSFGIYLLHHIVIFIFFQFTIIQHLYAYHALIAIITMFIIALSSSWIICSRLVLSISNQIDYLQLF